MAINTRGLHVLISPGGWVDKTMTTGTTGMLELIAKRHAEIRLNLEGDFLHDLRQRGVIKDTVLPGYYYRDDAMLIYDAINTYVKKIVHLFYKSTDDIVNDPEIQNWGKELITSPQDGGLGLRGVPNDGVFQTHDHLITVFRCIIFTCSVEHAAVNFTQYDDYAFTPFYPAILNGLPPTNKEPKLEEDILNILPTKSQMLDTMVITKILSTRSMKALGDFEVDYQHDPRALAIVNQFQDELCSISGEIKRRNEERQVKYTILDPMTVPNSISI